MNWVLYNLTATTKVGGMETSVWWLARALLGRGHQVTVVGGQSSRELPQVSQGVPRQTFPFRDRKSFPNLGTRARKLMERISFARAAMPEVARLKPDRLMIFKPYDIGPAIWARRKTGAPIGLYSGGVEPYPGAGLLAARLDYIAGFSQYNADRMARALGVPVKVNYPGVDLERFRPVEPDRELAAQYGIVPGDLVCVMAVRLVGWKGIQDAIRALDILRPSHPELKLLVAGEGPFKPNLESLIAELGLAGRVKLTGYLDPHRLAGFYALGRVGLFPSRGEEALGLSIAEAMACGLPVVAADQGGIPEVVGREGQGGLLSQPKDPQSLATALKRLLEDNGLYASAAKTCRARVGEIFSWDACAARLEKGLADGAKR